MKKCPFCAEEIQDEAIVCKHCGRELVPQATRSVSKITDNPSIALVSQKYAQKGYKVVSVTTDQITMERTASREPWWSILIWFLLFWPVGLLLLLIDLLKSHKTYHVQLTLGQDGEVREMGDSLEVFERDQLQASLKRHMGFGILFSILGSLAVIFLCFGVFVSLPGVSKNVRTWSEFFNTVWVPVFLFSLAAPLTIGPAILLLIRAKKIRQQLQVFSRPVISG